MASTRRPRHVQPSIRLRPFRPLLTRRGAGLASTFTNLTTSRRSKSTATPPRSEVTDATRHWATDPGNPGDAVVGQSWVYTYDPIGNRTYAERAGYGAGIF